MLGRPPDATRIEACPRNRGPKAGQMTFRQCQKLVPSAQEHSDPLMPRPGPSKPTSGLRFYWLRCVKLIVIPAVGPKTSRPSLVSIPEGLQTPFLLLSTLCMFVNNRTGLLWAREACGATHDPHLGQVGSRRPITHRAILLLLPSSRRWGLGGGQGGWRAHRRAPSASGAAEGLCWSASWA